MSTRYIVKPGDTLSGIAAAHGLKSYSSIYNHPENAAFKGRRPNPNLIFPGDVLMVPTTTINFDPVVIIGTPPPTRALPPGVLPVGRFSPAPSIIVDRTLTSVRITGAMELYGPEATAARAASIQRSINDTWNRTFEDGYSISCNVTVRYRGPELSAGNATQIEALKTSGPSHVSRTLGFDRSMTLNANEQDVFTWTPAHEFGHILGMKDRYTETIMSSLRGQFGGTRISTADPDYEHNLLAVHGGVIESKNVSDLAKENAPSPYWINDDIQVRDWVNAHSTVEIRMLATPHKIKMIQTLMSGWVSDDDLNAIVRMCGSVSSKAEAEAIRKTINPLDLTSLGQRTTLRVAFDAMPGGTAP